MSSDPAALRVLAWPNRRNETANPYSALLYAAIAQAHPELSVQEHAWNLRTLLGKWDIWHAHWPEYYLNLSWSRRWTGSLAVLLFAAVFRARGTKIIWTVHNLHPHEYEGRLTRPFYWLWGRLISATVHLTEAGVPEAERAHPRIRSRPRAVAWHGPYRPPADLISQHEARDRLGLPATGRLIGFLGSPRPYKGLSSLETQFAVLRAEQAASRASEPVALVIATARPHGTQPDAAIHYLDQRLDDTGLADLVRGCDVIVLPFRDIFNSGSLIHVLSVGGRVLAPDFPTLVESAARVRAGAAQFYDRSDGLQVSDLARALEPRDSPPPISQADYSAAWRDIAATVVDLYRRVQAG